MRHLFEYCNCLLSEYLINKQDKKETSRITGDDYYEAPPMTIYRANIEFGANWRDIHQKMQDWNEGKRKENIKACKDSKLIMYWKYCKDHKFTTCCELCEEEANRRGWTFSKIKEN